jgi:hypothetical protein
VRLSNLFLRTKLLTLLTGHPRDRKRRSRQEGCVRNSAG